MDRKKWLSNRKNIVHFVVALGRDEQKKGLPKKKKATSIRYIVSSFWWNRFCCFFLILSYVHTNPMRWCCYVPCSKVDKWTTASCVNNLNDQTITPDNSVGLQLWNDIVEPKSGKHCWPMRNSFDPFRRWMYWYCHSDVIYATSDIRWLMLKYIVHEMHLKRVKRGSE